MVPVDLREDLLVGRCFAHGGLVGRDLAAGCNGRILLALGCRRDGRQAKVLQEAEIPLEVVEDPLLVRWSHVGLEELVSS